MYQCSHCRKECKNSNSLRNHERLCPKNKKRDVSHIENLNKGKSTWNKGLTKDTSEILSKQSEKAKLIKKKPVSEKTKMRLSEVAKQRGLGGYRPHPNRGMMYKDIWFDSKWEVEVAKSLDENGISWERPRKGFVWNDKGNKYYPDFYLPKYDIYLDPKNDYLAIKDEEKISQSQSRNSIRVFVLSGDQLSWEAIRNLIEDNHYQS